MVDCWDNYCYYPWPIEVNVPSSGGSVWITFGGSVLLFIASMITLWKTIQSSDRRAQADRDAAQDRANADRRAAMQRAVDDRAADRANQLRVEVAAILAERPTTLDSQRRLMDATFQHNNELQSMGSTPRERSTRLLEVRQLHIDQSDKLEQLVIRALLLTTDPELDAALTKVREIAHNWNEPMNAAQAEYDVEKFEELQTRLTTALDELEAATRKLTAIESQ